MSLLVIIVASAFLLIGFYSAFRFHREDERVRSMTGHHSPGKTGTCEIMPLGASDEGFGADSPEETAKPVRAA